VSRAILPVTLVSPRGLHVHQNMFVVTEKIHPKILGPKCLVLLGPKCPDTIGHFGPRSEILRHFGPNFLGPKLCLRSEVSGHHIYTASQKTHPFYFCNVFVRFYPI